MRYVSLTMLNTEGYVQCYRMLDAVVGQPLRVHLALVAQRAVLGRDHERARLAGEVALQQRREVGPVQVGGRRGVQLHVAAYVARREQVVFAVLPHGVEVRGDGVVVVVRHGIEQHLRAGQELPAVAGHERHHGGQVPPGAVAEEHDMVGVHVGQKLARMQLAGHLVAVLGRLGEAVLGCAAVVHRHHAPLQAQRHRAAGIGVEVHVAVHPAAAVEEQHGAAEVLRDLEPLGQREVDVERGEHAQGERAAVGHRGRDVVDAAAGVGEGEPGAQVLGHALRLVELLDVGPKPRCRLEGGEHRLVDGHVCRPFPGRRRRFRAVLRGGAPRLPRVPS